ncbi:unnamed protein product [Phytomonas sp. EM1]|nr:unnamed protein product [Phytomonas sp. EM1]|eukprot:CCW60263.1 unnamed protein product [Phytomonas sp. isolate EM1]
MLSSSSESPGASDMKMHREKLQRFYVPRSGGLSDTVLSSIRAGDGGGGPSTCSTLLSDYEKIAGYSGIVAPEGRNARCDLEELRRARNLAARYSIENARLRDQLKAHALRESLLTERLQADHLTRLKHAADYPESTASAHQNEKVSSLYTSPANVIKSALPSHNNQLEAKERRISELELHVCGLEGRVKAYEEALQRSSGGASPSHSGISPTTHELICQCLSGMEYLVKVCNAVDHCRNTPHDGGDCPRTRRECTMRCLRAAMRGNTEPVGDILARGHQIEDHELMLSLREEIEYCETALVRTAAQLFAEYSQPNPSPTDTTRHQEIKLGSTSEVEKCKEHVSSSAKGLGRENSEDCAVQ